MVTFDDTKICSYLDSTLILLMWRIWCAPNSTSKWQTGFNLAFKRLRSLNSTILLSRCIYLNLTILQMFILNSSIILSKSPYLI